MFDEILASVPQTIIEVDTDLIIKFVNRPVASFFTRQVAIGDQLLDVVSTTAADALVDAIDNAQRIGRSLSEYRTTSAVYGVSAKPLESADGTLVIVESASQFDGSGATVRELLRDHKRFLSAVRYDLANPLSAVTGCASVLLEGGRSLNEETRSTLLRHMSDEAYDLNATLDDLRTAITIELGQLELASVLFDAAGTVTQVVEGLAPRSAVIEVEADPGVTVLGDPVHYRQIVRSLLINSLSHASGRIRVSIAEEDDLSVVSVRDKGELVSAEWSRPRERKPANYPTTPRKVGLGLWVSRELAAAMGGDLKFDHMDSETKFRLTVPSGRQ